MNGLKENQLTKADFSSLSKIQNIGGDKMSPEIIVALISLLGTLGGSLGGILVSSKMTNYRLQQLENKVAEHNNFARRMPVIEEQIKVMNHRIEDLEHEK